MRDDWNFGSVNSRQLTLRWIINWRFQRLDYERGFVFAPWRLLNPLQWIRSACCLENWRFWCVRHVGSTHRCYCPDGSSIDGSLVLAGFGVVWFYSHYTGEIPCWCDKALADIEEEETAARC
jgi:hypothetical protein